MPDTDPNAPPAGDQPPPPPPPPPADDENTTKPGPNSRPLTADVDHATNTSVATGTGTDALGQQVHPATQTREDDGHRTLANPKQDPGPYVPEGSVNVLHPDRTKGEHRFSDANEPLNVVMRTSTGHDLGFARPGGDTHTTEQLPPEVAVNGAASDCYHPTDGKETSLTADAVRKAQEPRIAAVARDGGDAPANGSENIKR